MSTLPHSLPAGNVFQRKGPRFTLTMIANPQFGLPWGSLPRLILAWMTTEAVRTKNSELNLGKSFASFLLKLNLSSGGGVRGNSTRVREQLIRLLTCHISCISHDAKSGHCQGDQFMISRSFDLWWNPLKTSQKSFKTPSKIILAKDFFDELISRPVPIDLRALLALRQSPLQVDIYIWLTYRFSFLKSKSFISWELLKNQFGSNYSENADGLSNFKRKFKLALNAVFVLYPEANIQVGQKGVSLMESQTHVKKRGEIVPKYQWINPVDN